MLILCFTQGRLQFFIEAIDSGLPNVIDSLLIDLDNLQLGADFTEEMTFTGFHDVSHMTMSFRVECSPGFCGHDCTAHQNNPRVVTCQANGTISCVHEWDPLQNCSECLNGRDPMTNCTTCLPGFGGNPCVRGKIFYCGESLYPPCRCYQFTNCRCHHVTN